MNDKTRAAAWHAPEESKRGMWNESQTLSALKGQHDNPLPHKLLQLLF